MDRDRTALYLDLFFWTPFFRAMPLMQCPVLSFTCQRPGFDRLGQVRRARV
jgi:hypothetical protein